MNRMTDKENAVHQTDFRAVGWLMQRLTGIGLLVLLALHFWLQHMPNGFLATAEEYNLILKDLGEAGPDFADALASGMLKEALPGEHVITYEKVLERLRSPVWKTIDIALLVLALSHGAQGFSRVIGDYVQRVRLRKAAVAVVWITTTLLAILGTTVILSVGVN